MNWLRAASMRMRGILAKDRTDRGLDEELRVHFEMLAEQNEQRGMTAEEGRRAARLELGGVDQIKESVQDIYGLRFLDSVFVDVRYAFRVLRKSPGFTAVAVLTLALGIGANTAIFSVVHAVLLRPLPYKDADRIVYLSGVAIEKENFSEWKLQSKSYDLFAAASIGAKELTGTGEAQRLQTSDVSEDYFSLWGVQPSLGRALIQADFPAGGRVVVISHHFWRDSLSADPKVVGRTIFLDRIPYSVVGVMPPGAGPFPYRNTEVWSPLLPGRSQEIAILARLKRGASLESARAEAVTNAEHLARAWARESREPLVDVSLFKHHLVEDSRLTLLLLSGAAGFVLLIVCANVANLLLAGLTGRRREIAVRIALGASRGRMMRQLLVEGVLLSALGAAFGLLAAHWATSVLVANVPYDVPRIDQSKIGGATLAFTLLLSGMAALVFSLLPAVAISAPDLNTTLKEGARHPTDALRQRRLRSAFVVIEFALVMIVLAGAGLLIKAFLVLRPTNPGFDPSDKLTMNVAAPYQGAWQQINFFREATDRISTLPGVRGVAFVSYMPMAGVGFIPDISVDGNLVAGINQDIRVFYRACTPNYLSLMHMPIVKGRDFSANDDERAPKVAIVSETMALRLWPGRNPIGRQVTVNWADQPTVFAVVGIVRDHRHTDTSTLARPEIYVPFWQDPARSMTLVIQTHDDSARLMPAVRSTLDSLDRDTVISDIHTMHQILDHAVAVPRYNAQLFGVLGGLALMLAIAGIYGVTSYAVSQRTHEIGVRMALGAQPGSVMRAIIGEGVVLALLGVVIGGVAALALAQLLENLLYEIKSTDPATFAAVAVLLILVAVAASCVPARRAVRVDPMIALRYE